MVGGGSRMCSVAGTRRAELECSVLEEDWQRGQRYVAHWHCPTLIPEHHHHHHRMSMMEAERSAKHWEARRLLQRFLSGAINKNYPHPKTQSTSRPHQSIPDPSTTGTKLQQGPVNIQKEVCCVTVRPKSTVIETRERKTVVKIAKLARFLG